MKKQDKKLPRIFINVDKGIVFSAVGTIEAELVILNLDKENVQKMKITQTPNRTEIDEYYDIAEELSILESLRYKHKKEKPERHICYVPEDKK
jgi:hypothetical protein